MFGEICPQNAQWSLSRDLQPNEEGTEGEGRVMKKLLCLFMTRNMRAMPLL